MTDTTSVANGATAADLTKKIKDYVKGNWVHAFEIADDRTISTPENFTYRRRMFEGVFGSLLRDRSVVVLEEASGIYPVLLQRAGTGPITAASASPATCGLMREVWAFFDVEATDVNSRLVAFYDGVPYVDGHHREAFEFLLAVNHIWGLYTASGQSFDAVVEACAALVTDGLVFDWTGAEWASPPPEYTRDAFCAALEKKFDYVTVYSDWLVVANSKLR